MNKKLICIIGLLVTIFITGLMIDWFITLVITGTITLCMCAFFGVIWLLTDSREVPIMHDLSHWGL